jgi:cation diffusion facilitator family transporter
VTDSAPRGPAPPAYKIVGKSNLASPTTRPMDHAAETEQQVRRGLRSSFISIASNFLLAASKCVAGMLGHSFALVADGIESLTDVFSSIVVYLGLRLAIKPPDKEHPWGHGKAEPVAAATVSLVMAAAGVGIAVESIVLLRTPHPLPAPYTLWVLLAVFGVKLLLTRYVSSVAHSIDSTAVRGDAWHHLSDAITSLFAFVGISVALWTRDFRADDWAALCAAPVILFSAWRQIRSPMEEILDTAPPPEIEQHVREAAASVAGVVGLEKCFVRKVGFRYYVDLHVVVDGDISVRSGHAISHKVEDRVLADVTRVAKVLVHIEPEEELMNPSHSDM